MPQVEDLDQQRIKEKKRLLAEKKELKDQEAEVRRRRKEDMEAKKKGPAGEEGAAESK